MKMNGFKRALIWLITLSVCFVIVWPVYWIVKSSFTEPEEIFAMPVQYLPINWTLESYQTLLSPKTNTWKYIGDTVILTTVTIAVSTALCALAGYAFARTKTKGIRRTFAFILFSTMVPGTVAIIPLMVLWRSLRLTDTIQGLSILYLSMIIPFSTIMFSTFIQQIPNTLEEAAWIDGSGVFSAFFRVIFPLLTPIMATLCIINFITCVNEFFYPLVFTTKRVKVLSMLVYNVPRVNEWQDPWGTIAASGCLMLLPTVLFILFFEKRIMAGLMMGSIKQ